MVSVAARGGVHVLVVGAHEQSVGVVVAHGERRDQRVGLAEEPFEVGEGLGGYLGFAEELAAVFDDGGVLFIQSGGGQEIGRAHV